jgi:hypothetical protein
MKTIKRKRVNGIQDIDKEPISLDVEEIIIQDKEKIWKESTGTTAKSKFCKPCIKKSFCVIGSLAMIMTCDKIQLHKKKRIKDL